MATNYYSKSKKHRDIVFVNTEYKSTHQLLRSRLYGGREQLLYLETCQEWASSNDNNLIATKLLAFPKPFESILDTPKLETEVMRALVNIITCKNMLQPGIATNETRKMLNKVFAKVADSQLITSTQNLSLLISDIFEGVNSFDREDIQLLRRITDLLEYLLETFPSECLCVSACINLLYNFNKLDPDTPQLPTDVSSKINDLYEHYKNKRLRNGKRNSVSAKPKRDQFSDNYFYGISYQQMSILPSHDEIFRQKHPKLRYLMTEGAYPTAEVYMDVLFKLLREDMLSPLRTGIKNLIALSESARKDLYMYDKVKNLGIQCSPRHGILYKISFEPYGIKNPEKIQWDKTSRLRFGTLLCITPKFNNLPIFETTLWAVVADTSENLANGFQVSIKFSGYEQEFTPGLEYFMVESRSAFYEAYSHTLSVIQQVDPEDIPMKRIILGQETKCSHPRYINNETKFNFSGIFPDHEELSVLGKWPSDTTILDHSQQKALRLALTKQVALIQGPPGTGKTYIGVHTMKILLAARNKSLESYSWKQSQTTNTIRSLTDFPILIVAYTNHALDQFLVSLLDYEENIIRIGSRIEQEILETKTLYEVRKRVLKKKEKLPKNIGTTRTSCGQIRNRLKQMQDLIEKVSVDLNQINEKTLSENDVARFATVRQYQSMFRVRNEFKQVLEKGKTMCDYWLYGDESKAKCKQRSKDVTKSSGYVNKYFLDENHFKLLADIEENSDEEEVFDREAIISRRLDYSGVSAFELKEIQTNDSTTEEHPFRLEISENSTRCEHIDQDVVGAVLPSDKSMPQTDEYEETKQLQRILDQDSDTEDCASKNILDDRYFLEQQKPKSESEDEFDERNIALDEALFEMDLGSISDEADLPHHIRTCANVWDLGIDDRYTLYNYWLMKKNMLLNEVIDIYSRDYCELSTELQKKNIEIDSFVLKTAAIVGMTTTGAAKNSELLKRVKPRIIFVEEAAEVLEAHIISSLSSELEHLILIGDHQQLRPSNAVYELAVRYNLNLSLFERLINNEVEHVTLEYQHRMRPEISRLIKPIYPLLQDHPVVLNRDAVKGMSSNIFFINHLKLEDPIKGDSTTRTNSHEAKFISKLAFYLTKQGYTEEEITILTFYQGQKYLIQDFLLKSKMDCEIRVSTVDKFQGEENTIILFSAVRSNQENNIGYCKVDNRVCVALSRARNGFYMIGNAQCLRIASKSMKNDLWNHVINNFNENIGANLVLCCQKHPKTKSYVKDPEDFRKVRNGGCNAKCDERMECGHKCELLCHPYSHETVECFKQCEKKYDPCGHPCRDRNGRPRLCYEDCGECTVLVEKSFPCGHKIMSECGSDSTSSECQFTSDLPVELFCGHKQSIPCFLSKCDMLEICCKEKCQSKLECGHTCPGTCSSCFRNQIHQPCSRPCDKSLACGHLCMESCHWPYSCGSCKAQCRTRCVHGICTRVCGDMCSYCSEPCEWVCPSFICQQACSDPCVREKCYKRCKFRLECGHACLGVCGEPCPQVCSICHPNDPTFNIFFGDEKRKSSKFVVLEDCHHVFEIHGLDRWMRRNYDKQDMKSTRLELPKCPLNNCGAPMVKNLRYGTLIKFIQMKIEETKEMMKYEMQNHLLKQCEQMSKKLMGFDYLRAMLEYSQEILELIPLCDNTKLSVIRDLLQIFADTCENKKTLWTKDNCHYSLLNSLHITSVLDSPAYRPGVDDVAISQLNAIAVNCRFKLLFYLAFEAINISQKDKANLTKLKEKFEKSTSKNVSQTRTDLLSSCKLYLNNFFCKYRIQLPPTHAMPITKPYC